MKIKRKLLYVWQLPQHLLALLLLKKFPYEKKHYYETSTIYVLKKGNFAVSLGEYILVDKSWLPGNHIIRHEYGHTKQSHMLGPLYLFIVGIPSAFQNKLGRILAKKGNNEYRKNYYNRFPENWADKLGGVDR